MKRILTSLVVITFFGSLAMAGKKKELRHKHGKSQVQIDFAKAETDLERLTVMMSLRSNKKVATPLNRAELINLYQKASGNSPWHDKF